MPTTPTKKPTPPPSSPTDFASRLLAEIEAAHAGDGAPRPFADLRAEARDVFAATGFPSTKQEAYKYTDLQKALREDLSLLEEDPSDVSADVLAPVRIEGLGDAAHVVLVNGVFAEHLSDTSRLPEGVTLTGLGRAMSEHREVVEKHFGQIVDATDDAMVALNAAFDLDGVFLHVPKNTVVETPIVVTHLLDLHPDATTGAFVQSRHLHVIEENAQVKVVETMHRTGRTAESTVTFGNHLVEVHVGQNAHVDAVRIQDEGSKAGQVTSLYTRQIGEKPSTYSHLAFTFAGGVVRNNITSQVDAPGCETNLSGLYILEGEEHCDTHTLLDHIDTDGQSNELYKGIVYDQATGVFNGKVYVHPTAQRTNAYQQSQGVILDPDATFYAKPELEIYADDVKCSHGSTTGAIDPEGMFYLRSRGLSEADARAMLLYAFAIDIAEMVSLEPVREHIDRRITERLK